MKKEFKGTPGPWRVDGLASNGIVNNTIISVSGKAVGYAPIANMLRFNPYPIPEEQIEANARLIATAPELLESLQDMLDIIERIWFPGFDLTKKKEYLRAKEVINKALEE